MVIQNHSTIQLITKIINRSSVKVRKMQYMEVKDDKIIGNFWATDNSNYAFSLDEAGQLSYRQQKTRRRL